jgi:hypothetical protein
MTRIEQQGSRGVMGHQIGVREDLFGEPNMNRIGADDSVQGSTRRITRNAWSRLLWLMFDSRG